MIVQRHPKVAPMEFPYPHRTVEQVNAGYRPVEGETLFGWTYSPEGWTRNCVLHTKLSEQPR